MKYSHRYTLTAIVVLTYLGLMTGLAGLAHARQKAAATPPPVASAVVSAASAASVASPSADGAASAAAASADDEDSNSADADEDQPRKHRHNRGGTPRRTVVSIGHGASLAAGESADDVVAVLGSASSAGDVSGDVVAVLGQARVTGPAGGDAVAVLGNTFVDSKVDGDVVAVLGNVELGPHAEVGGGVTAVGGTLTRDPAAVVHGEVQDVSFGAGWVGFEWLQSWVGNCLLKGRLLAFAPGLEWAWMIAFISLGLYVLTGWMFRGTVERCADTLQRAPGQSLLAAMVTTLAVPLLIVLLGITVIGVLAIPFVGIALLVAASFGRVAVLAWVGSRILRPAASGARPHAALTVLVGGLIVLLLYTIPIIGFILFQLIGFIGLGAVVYALLQMLRASRAARQPPPAAAAAATPPPGYAGVDSNAASESAAAPDANAEPGTSAAAEAGVAAGAAASSGAAPGAATAARTVNVAAAASYPRAGFWIRMFALLIDIILVGAVTSVVWHSDHVFLVLLAAYGAVLWKLKGATVGDIVCNLHVVRLDGREIDWATAIVRALGCFLSLFVAGLGFIWIAIDRDRQAWHDKIAGTVVVTVPKGVSLV